jgi:hypothetical protein
MRVDLPQPVRPYTHIRYRVQSSGGGNNALGAIEYFGIMDSTDGDGVPDYFEDRYAFLNPDNPDNPDSDNDGLRDFAEINLHNTYPRSAGTDGDQIPDGYKVAMGSDPNDPIDLPDFPPVDWDAPANITGSFSDFKTAGELVHAWTGGGSNVGIQNLGITFQPGPSLCSRFTGYDPYQRGGDQDYETLLDSGSFNTLARFLEIPGLTAGQTYRIQIWLADTRNGSADRVWTIGTYDLDLC